MGRDALHARSQHEGRRSRVLVLLRRLLREGHLRPDLQALQGLLRTLVMPKEENLVAADVLAVLRRIKYHNCPMAKKHLVTARRVGVGAVQLHSCEDHREAAGKLLLDLGLQPQVGLCHGTGVSPTRVLPARSGRVDRLRGGCKPGKVCGILRRLECEAKEPMQGVGSCDHKCAALFVGGRDRAGPQQAAQGLHLDCAGPA
mmetsp:Transcript_74302/g.221702  ORF Transcript_74302/g.221702 Transcript_74302/m.221702 type:complete len:201 (+) Transcript_74302:555-1157(+)